MRRYKETKAEKIGHVLLRDYLPNQKDNLKYITIKVLFLISLILLIFGSLYIGGLYYQCAKEKKILENQRRILKSGSLENAYSKLWEQNHDYKAWISLRNTSLNYPVFQTDDNSFYLNHNSKKQKSRYGSLFFDYRSVIEDGRRDKNLVIYGNSPNGDALFGPLHKLRSLGFYQKNSVIDLVTKDGEYSYKIYAIFVLNAKEPKDSGDNYNIYRKTFANDSDFDGWVNGAKERSVINTSVDVKMGDNILTLVTHCDDFENARLVVMAREIRSGEWVELDTPAATVNDRPKYPKKWYEERNIEYPSTE
ncbi:MAG: class B sortase [Acutalibacteraceae bacterium]|jgi:sortase B